jgi:hypothetical protein
MKCQEIIFDKRTKKHRVCNAEVYGLTGLMEIEAYQRHLRQKHGQRVDMRKALEMRAETGQ